MAILFPRSDGTAGAPEPEPEPTHVAAFVVHEPEPTLPRQSALGQSSLVKNGMDRRPRAATAV